MYEDVSITRRAFNIPPRYLRSVFSKDLKTYYRFEYHPHTNQRYFSKFEIHTYYILKTY